MPASEDSPALCRELLDACAILEGEGLTGAFGHVSARLGDGRVLISPRRAPALVREASELIVLNAGTGAPEDESGDPPAELWAHLGVYATRGDVQAVARIHSPNALAYSTLGRPLDPTVAYGAFLAAPIPVQSSPRPARSPQEGEALAGVLGDAGAMLMRGGGQVTVGESVPEAVVRAVLLEKTAAAALAAPEALLLTPEELRRFAPTQAVHRGQMQRVWEYLRGRHC